MNAGRQLVALVLAMVLLPSLSCTKNKPQLPSQATAPAEPLAVALPPDITEETPPPPAPVAQEEESKPVEDEEPKPQPTKRRKKKPSQPPATTQAAPNAPANGSSNSTLAAAHSPANPASESPPDTAIAANVTGTQLLQQKQTTAQLLDATEKTLSGLHDLSHDEEEMVVEIRSYVTQSRRATTDGDFERAYNLATKAHLLSDALVKK